MDWEGLYAKLDALLKSLVPPQSTIDSFHVSIESVRKAHRVALLIYTRMSREQLNFKIRLKAAKGKRSLGQDDGEIEDIEQRLAEIMIFMKALEKTISAFRDFRADLSKRVRLFEMEFDFTKEPHAKVH